MFEDTLQQIKRVLQTGEISWTEIPVVEDELKDLNARSYRGYHSEGWMFVVVEFDTEPQGFPPGSKGYDGTAVNSQKFIMIRLTRELAEELFEAAKIHKCPCCDMYTKRDGLCSICAGPDDPDDMTPLFDPFIRSRKKKE